MTSKRRSNTVSISDADRGQTVQDFSVGIGIFILAIAFTMTFVPTMITPHDDVDGTQTAQADRIAGTVLHNLSAESEEPNTIDLSDFDDRYGGNHVDYETFADRVGVRSVGNTPIDRVNVTVEEFGSNGGGEVHATGGVEYDGQSGSSVTRIVNVEDPTAECDPACKLVVRVW